MRREHSVNPVFEYMGGTILPGKLLVNRTDSEPQYREGKAKNPRAEGSVNIDT